MPSNQGAQQCRCVLCSVVVESSTTRRKLGSRATKHIIPVIQGLASRRYHGSEILQPLHIFAGRHANIRSPVVGYVTVICMRILKPVFESIYLCP